MLRQLPLPPACCLSRCQLCLDRLSLTTDVAGNVVIVTFATPAKCRANRPRKASPARAGAQTNRSLHRRAKLPNARAKPAQQSLTDGNLSISTTPDTNVCHANVGRTQHLGSCSLAIAEPSTMHTLLNIIRFKHIKISCRKGAQPLGATLCILAR